MAGYGGQEIALDVDTPSQLEQAAAQADLSQTQSQLAKATLPADIQYKQALASNEKSTADQSALTLDQQKQLWGLRQARAAQMANTVQSSLGQVPQGGATSQLATPTSAPLFSPQVDAVMHSIDPNDPQASQKWDAAMIVAAKDDPSAAQFVGKYSPTALQGWLQQIGANAVKQASSPLAALPPVQPGQSFEQAMAPVGAPGTPYGGAQSPLGANPATPVANPSPLTGQVDPVMQQMAVLFPEEYKKQVALEGQMKFLQTGNLNDFARTNPAEFKNLMEGYNAQTEAQHKQVEMKADMMGRAAFAVLDLGHTQSENWLKAHPGDNNGAALAANSGAALAAYRTAIIDAANNKWISPDVARARLAAPIDWGFVSSTSIQGQTVSQSYKALGLEKANEQRAEINNPLPHFSANNVDANGNIIVTNATPRPGTSPITVTNIQAGSKGAITTQAKEQMLIQGGVPPQEAAQIAAGLKPMTPERIAATARALAIREQSNQTNAHLMDPSVQVQNVDELTNQYTQQLSQTGGAPTPSMPNTPAPSGQRTAAQNNVFTAFIAGHAAIPNAPTVKYDPNAQWGSAQKPYVPTSKTDYDRLSKGTHFIAQDGTLRIKP